MPVRDLIVRTKLYRPQLIPELVVRNRLHDLLTHTGEVPLTLVSAPAGYGKSVAVSQWIEDTGQSAAWISLDPEDSELPNFLTYVVAALETVVPGCARGTAELLTAPELPPVQAVAGQLLNDLDALDDPCLLVLDDYHRIIVSSPVHEILNRLLAHPPRRTRIVLVSRQDPPLALAGPRGMNGVAEVRLQDLRFTANETGEFLQSTTRQTVSAAALENVQYEIEGWAVGLKLVTLAMRHAEDPDDFLCGMKGGLALTREYLMQEVLASLEPEVRRYMLASSILNRFCAELLEAVAGPGNDGLEPGEGAEAFLLMLQEANLFTIALDSQGAWYRYHHLFQELLINELQHQEGPSVVSDLHTRASAWFETAGLIDEALRHALASGEMERAVQLVESHWRDAVDNDRWFVLEAWLDLLPTDVIQSRPQLLVARGWYLLHHVRFEAVLPLADRVESLIGDDPRHDALRGQIELFRGYILFFLGDGANSLRHIEVAQAKIPVHYYEARAQSEVINSLSSQMVGRKETALQELERLVACYDSPAELRLTRLVVAMVMIHYIAGEPAAAEVPNRRMREVAERGGFAYAAAWSDYLQGLIHLQRGELDRAVERLSRAVAQRFIFFKRAAVDSLVGLMLAQQQLGRDEEAQAALQQLRDYVEAMDDPVLWSLSESAEARLAVKAGRPETAVSWLAGGEPAYTGAMLWWLEVPSVTRCRVEVAAGSPTQLAAAAERLEGLAAEIGGRHNITQLVGIYALLAVAQSRLGLDEDARNTLAKAVVLAMPGGLVFPFVEAGAPLVPLLGKLSLDGDAASFVARLSAACSEVAMRIAGSGEHSAAVKPRAETAGGVLDDLTTRELDVLALLENRMQDKEIATRLDISVHTVRHHLKQIYQKLDVHGRRQAVRRGREIGLLGDEASG